MGGLTISRRRRRPSSKRREAIFSADPPGSTFSLSGQSSKRTKCRCSPFPSPQVKCSHRSAHHVVSGHVQEKELEEVLAGYYAAAMEVDDELEVVVLPPFALHNYDPRTDLHDIAVLLTLAPGTTCSPLPTGCVRVPRLGGLTRRVCQSLSRGPGGGERCAIEQRPAGSGLWPAGGRRMHRPGPTVAHSGSAPPAPRDTHHLRALTASFLPVVAIRLSHIQGNRAGRYLRPTARGTQGTPLLSAPLMFTF